MIAERVVRAFWPLWSVVFLLISPLMFGWHRLVSVEFLWGGAIIGLVAIITAAIWGARRYRHPSVNEALGRVDASLPDRPLSAIADAQAIGRGDPASEAVWRVHMARMEDRSREAVTVAPDLRVSDRDPYGVRFIALLFFLCALLFGSVWQLGSVDAVTSGEGELIATGPVWEGWVEPPAYTGKPAIYLNDVPQGRLNVPVGSKLTLRLYGELGGLTVSETVSGRTSDLGAASDPQQKFVIERSGELAVEGGGGRRWQVTAIVDQEPLVELTGPIEADAMGELSQPFLAMDDYGVESGTATFALDLSVLDRRHGLTVDPDPMDPLVLDLPMPFTGDRRDFDSFLVEDLSQHPFANLPVTLEMQVVDAAGQMASSLAEPMILPGRRFFQPFARAIIEQRRDLMWSKANRGRVAQILRALSHRPEGLFSNETTYLRMRAIIRRLEAMKMTGLSDEVQAEVVQAMWDLAIQLEDGTLADARERLRRAQERLAEAMRNGASEAEIEELMNELREATDDYMQMLADQMEPTDGTDQADNSENSREISGDEIQALMDRIQELMEEGRMAEAAELMQQLNDLLENLRITQGDGSGDGPRTPGQQSMEDLAETLEEQEQLSDDAFRELQERANRQQGNQQGQQQQGNQQGGEQGGQQKGQQGQQQNQSGQEGQQGQGQGVGRDSQSGQQGDHGAGGEGEQPSLADRQQALRDELDRQRGNLPNLEGEAGEVARRALEQAEGAMDRAEQALRNGDLAEAIDRQAEAMNALRNGMRSLNQALAQDRSNEPGQGSERGETTGSVEPMRRDPLGRELGNTGQLGTDQELLGGEDVYRRAEELLGEIRRRSGEQTRPEVERNYLRRLLDQF